MWLATDPSVLRPGEAAARAGPSFLAASAVSIWEARIKWATLHRSGVRKAMIGPTKLVETLVAAGYALLDLTPAHAVTMAAPIAHKDPFDALMPCQAQGEGLRLLTRDRGLAAHPLTWR